MMVNSQDKWQEECIEQWRVTKGIGLVEAVTGSGKTILAVDGQCQNKLPVESCLLKQVA